MEDLVPFLIAIAYFVFQGINASRKKKAKKERERQQAQEHAQPAPEYVPEQQEEERPNAIEEFLAEIQELSQQEGAAVEAVPEEEYIHPLDQPEPVVEEHKGHEDTLEPMHYEVPEEAEPQFSHEAEEYNADEEQEQAFAFDDDSAEKESSIDLRQAIVYDAILNRPKY